MSDLKTVRLKIWTTESRWINFSVSGYCIVYVLFNMWKFWSSGLDALWELVFVFPFSIDNFFLSFFDKSCEVLKELDHDYIFDLRSAFWRGFFFPEFFFSKFWFCFSFTGPTLDSRDHFLNETFTTMKVWKKMQI